MKAFLFFSFLVLTPLGFYFVAMPMRYVWLIWLLSSIAALCFILARPKRQERSKSDAYEVQGWPESMHEGVYMSRSSTTVIR
jgi:hypothetical protein